MLGGGTPEKRAADAAEIAESLATSLDGDTPDMDQYFKKGNPGLIRKAYRLVMFPLMFTNMVIRLTLWMFLNVLLGPCMAMLWRTRRYLADASSVELTRNPDALARALQCLSEDNTAFDSGDWATHLFVVNPKGDSGLRGQQPSQQQMAKAIQAWASTAHMMSAQDAANLYDVPVTDGVAARIGWDRRKRLAQRAPGNNYHRKSGSHGRPAGRSAPASHCRNDGRKIARWTGRATQFCRYCSSPTRRQSCDRAIEAGAANQTASPAKAQPVWLCRALHRFIHRW